MNQKVLRLCILLSAAALAACTAKKPRPALKPAGTTVQPVNTYRTPQPAGQRAAAIASRHASFTSCDTTHACCASGAERAASWA